MEKIPKRIIDEHKKGVEVLMFYGVPVTELDRDGLLAFANLCAKSLKDATERFHSFVDTARAMDNGRKRVGL